MHPYFWFEHSEDYPWLLKIQPSCLIKKPETLKSFHWKAVIFSHHAFLVMKRTLLVLNKAMQTIFCLCKVLQVGQSVSQSFCLLPLAYILLFELKKFKYKFFEYKLVQINPHLILFYCYCCKHVHFPSMFLGLQFQGNISWKQGPSRDRLGSEEKQNLPPSGHWLMPSPLWLHACGSYPVLGPATHLVAPMSILGG